MKQILLSLATVLHLITHTNTPSAQYVRLLPHVMNAQVSAVQKELTSCTLAQHEITQLIEAAQNEKKRIKLEIDALGGKKIRWGLLGKGFVQMLGAAYCLFNTGATVWSGVKTARRDTENYLFVMITGSEKPEIVCPPYLTTLLDDAASNGLMNYFKNILAILIHPALACYKDMYATFEYHDQRKYVTASVVPLATLIFLWATNIMRRKSTQNLKAGWNYLAVLEKKITQLDEIITYLETHATQSKQ